MSRLAPLAALLCAACSPTPTPIALDGGVAACAGCHGDENAAWANPSSHRLLFQCVDCHAVADGPGVAGHAQSASCRRCHSEVTHHGACDACHDPHGSENAFLVRAAIALPDGGTALVHLTAPEGVSPDGLARAGADGGVPGTGLCEVCHDATGYFDDRGEGAPHHTEYCARCHDHQAGFAAVAQ